jgi:hypothetical protein
MEDRNTLLAHNDLTPHRGVLIITRGAFGPKASAKSERATLNLVGVAEVRGLFAFQGERLDRHLAELVELLRDAEGWLDGVEMQLTL